MINTLGKWARAGFTNYTDNPTSKKDFRSQLRGNAAIYLWTCYLVILLAISMVVYTSVFSRASEGVSITQLQSNLREFYQILMGCLASVICLITPALTAGTITGERQRRSLDLLFSAPVSVKGLLVGKLISSYRYTWMLLVLSLPITAVCIVMGGATWGDVLAGYAILSFSALVLTSIGLVVSCMTTSLGAAILWTYLAVTGYLFATTIVSAASSVRLMMSAGDPTVAGWAIGLNPFLVVQAAPTHCELFGLNIPNWIPAGILALLFSRVLILGGASALGSYGAKETKWLRVYALIYTFLFCGFISLALINTMPTGDVDFVLAIFGVVISGACLFFLPYLVSFHSDSPRKYRDDGIFDLNKILIGSPAGNLPFLLLTWLSIFGGLLAGRDYAVYDKVGFTSPYYSASSTSYSPLLFYPGFEFACGAAWSIGFFLMCWGIGRFISSRAKTLRNARLLFIASVIALFGMPVPILAILQSVLNGGYYSGGPSPIWMLHPLYPLFDKNNIATAPIYGVLMLAIGLLAFQFRKATPIPIWARPAPSLQLPESPPVTPQWDVSAINELVPNAKDPKLDT